ncbi:MAG: WecB/TagA/CpsF family glycosyltransferase [Parcubacteria group bacterium]|jgi:N-acetylglucosaminyldiphosphoundecaprenol N-acetyl-beta-D-mannosaminyltransferase
MEELNKNIRKEILGVRIDNLDRVEILDKIKFFLSEPKFHQIATINPEFILEAQKNSELKNILNASDLNVADGFGIKLAFWRFGKHLKCRLAGADLILEILKIAQTQKLSVFLAVNKKGLSTFKEIRDAILKSYPDIKIFGFNYILTNNTSIQPYKEVLELIKNNSDRPTISDNYNIVFCNFGAPNQELFINSQKCDTIRLAMGVGGSFDFITKKVRRAPKFMQIIGFEWLWRIFQPQEWKFKKERLKRIFQAVIIFPIRVIFNK